MFLFNINFSSVRYTLSGLLCACIRVPRIVTNIATSYYYYYFDGTRIIPHPS